LSITSKSLQSIAPVPAPVPARAKPVPLSPGRFALQVTVDQATHDQLRYAQALLGHSVPSGDVAEVLKRALDALVEKLEKQKFANSSRSRKQRVTAKGRHIPAAVRRAVWKRDSGKCTFVGEKGKRCESRMRVKLDHVIPIAQGGQTTTSNLRLLCHAHNQFTAECAFGEAFMHGRRAAGKNCATRSFAASGPN
jgi:5-methylcytosine-specific restriction endonuclease McrA